MELAQDDGHLELQEESPPPQDQSQSPKSSAPQFINLNEHKAGLVGLDKEKINKIIQEASKGSNFYIYQQKRQKRIDTQIGQFRTSLKNVTAKQRKDAILKADSVIAELESRRQLNRILVHFDMDMFFAAVEIKYNPSLADKPVAVGSMAMISTSNYVARKFGVRSAMAGFIAKKLCPELILISHNRHSYSKESKCIMNIIAEYDPNLNCFSLDEVYIDLTDYVFSRYSTEKSIDIGDLYQLTQLPEEIWNYSYEIVNCIRARIYKETQLSVSAGISCNTLLAKVCTDINKPNGQFMVKGYRNDIMDFVSRIEVRKFSGVGPVRGQILSALNINTGKDILDDRATIFCLFSEHNAYYYMRLSLGIGSSFLDNEEVAQKSHSREITVAGVSQLEEMCKLLMQISQRLSQDLKSHSQQGRTITLKLKKTTFEVFLKSKSINKYTDDEKVLLKVAKELLSQEVTKSPFTSYRLIGIKVSNLKENDIDAHNSQPTLSQILKTSTSKKGNSDEKNSEMSNQCRLCEQVFEDPSELNLHKLVCDGDLEELSLHSEGDNLFCDDDPTENACDNQNVEEIGILEENSAQQQQNNIHSDLGNNSASLTCPICLLTSIFADNDQLNRHIDTCLNRGLLCELTKIPQTNSTSTFSSLAQVSAVKSKSKRKSPKSCESKNKKLKSQPDVSANSQMKIDHFFAKK